MIAAAKFKQTTEHRVRYVSTTPRMTDALTRFRAFLYTGCDEENRGLHYQVSIGTMLCNWHHWHEMHH